MKRIDILSSLLRQTGHIECVKVPLGLGVKNRLLEPGETGNEKRTSGDD